MPRSRPARQSASAGRAGRPASRLQVSVVWFAPQISGLRRLLQDVARSVAAAEGFRGGRLCIAIIDNRYMRRLHRQFLGSPAATDVLAFDLGCDRATGRLEADIVVCLDVAVRYCRRALKLTSNADPVRNRQLAAALRAELALYVTHGILHLCGYDDHSRAGASRMHAREKELLARCGLTALPEVPAAVTPPLRSGRR